MNILKWFTPGIRIKRWLFLVILGLFFVSCGFTIFFRFDFSGYNIALRIPRIIPVQHGYEVVLDLALIFTGVTFIYIGFRKLLSSIFSAVAPYEDKKNLINKIYENRHLDKGVNVVAIGGGTGLSTLLRGLKNYTTNITAIVTVSDDGGSSGRLRKDLHTIPPGDIRNCLVALSASESLMADLFQYRFHDCPDLEGHSFGNLFLVALSDVVGDFDRAIKESSKVLAIKGKVLPATLEPVVLVGKMEDGSIIEGESSITGAAGKVNLISLKPPDPAPAEEVIESIRGAEVIIFGPGSLYTSVIPNLLVPGIIDAIKASKAIKVYVCNVMTQPGETDGYTAGKHLEVLFEHTGCRICDSVIVNSEIPTQSDLLEKYRKEGAYPVEMDGDKLSSLGVRVISDKFISETDLVRHNPDKLAQIILKQVR